MESVALVALTQPALGNDSIKTPEDLITYCARVSNPSNQLNTETAPKLLKYLIQHKHWSPFEMVSMTVEIKTSRAIAAQILRHRSFSFQEFCMSGESEIYFDLPGQVAIGKRKLYTMKLKDIHSKWNSTDGIGNSLKNRIQNMFVRVYDEDTKTLTHAHIKDVFQTGVKQLFEIELFNGKKFKCTKEHKVLSPNGFISLEDGAGLQLIGGKAVFTNKHFTIGTNGIPLYQSYDWLLEQKQIAIKEKTGVAGIAIKAGVSYHTIRKWLKKHNLQFTKKEVAEYTDTWNKGKIGYKTKPHSIQTILKMKASARKGSASNLWRGGVCRKQRAKITDWCASIRQLKLKECGYSCASCGSSASLELDHIKPVYSNPELAYAYDNIQVLCKSCHSKKHNNSGDQKIWRSKHSGNTMTVSWSKIKSVKYLGEEMTYDLHIGHNSHNYVADGVIVHNSQRYSTTSAITDVDLRKQAEKNRQSSEESFDPTIDNEKASKIVSDHMEAAMRIYAELIQAGVAKECARMVLPLATETTLYMSGTIRSWIHYLELRTTDDTQLEHRQIALQIREIFRKEFPVIFEALWGT